MNLVQHRQVASLLGVCKYYEYMSL